MVRIYILAHVDIARTSVERHLDVGYSLPELSAEVNNCFRGGGMRSSDGKVGANERRAQQRSWG